MAVLCRCDRNWWRYDAQHVRELGTIAGESSLERQSLNPFPFRPQSVHCKKVFFVPTPYIKLYGFSHYPSRYCLIMKNYSDIVKLWGILIASIISTNYWGSQQFFSPYGIHPISYSNLLWAGLLSCFLSGGRDQYSRSLYFSPSKSHSNFSEQILQPFILTNSY